MMMYTTGPQQQNTYGERAADIHGLCKNLKADIDMMSIEPACADEQEKIRKMQRLQELKQILVTIEDIDHSIDSLLQEQQRRRSLKA